MPGRLGTQRGRRTTRLGGGYKAVVMGDAPLGYWRLDETSGTTAVDSSGNGRHGTITGSNFILNQPGAITRTDPGAKSIKWTGGATHILVPHGTWMNVSTAASWEWWINPVSNGNNAGIFSRYQNGGGGGLDWLHWYNTNSQIEFRVNISGTSKGVLINPPQLGGVWTHLVATFDGSSLRAYVNSQLVGTTTAAGSIDANAGDISLGSYSAGTWNLQNQYLDEVGFYGSTLSAARIAAHYNAGVGISA